MRSSRQAEKRGLGEGERWVGRRFGEGERVVEGRFGGGLGAG